MEFCMKLLTEDMIKIAQPVAAQSKPNLSTNTPPKVGPMKALEKLNTIAREISTAIKTLVRCKIQCC